MENIEEKNTGIHDFMGLIDSTGFRAPANCLGQNINEEDMMYHSSWDWLIPVLQKIESIASNYTHESKERRDFEDIFTLNLFLSAFMQNNIEWVYMAVTEFIELYHKQN